MKKLDRGLGRLSFYGFILLIVLSVWTNPAFSIARSDGVVDVLSAENPVEIGCFSASYGDQTSHALEYLSPPILSGDPISECPSSFEAQVIFFINHERHLVGLAPLELDVRLQTAARWMSDDMADRNHIPSNHVDSLGRTFDVRVEEEGGYPYTYLGEVIAGGYPTPESVVEGWMNSPGHKANLLEPEFDHIGVGYTFDSSTDYWYYWTADLGSTLEPRQSPPVDCDPRFYLLYLPLIQK